MNNKLSVIEIVFTAIIILVACIGIGLTDFKLLDKGKGELTAENYSDYMQVTCGAKFGYSDGVAMRYNYNITIIAQPHYSLDNVTVYFSLKNHDGTITASLGAGESHSEIFTVSFEESELEITVNSVTGYYSFVA